jgi:hypothetical protein
MNKAKLAQNLYGRVRLRPIAWRRTTDGEWLPAIDDEWIITEIGERALRISNNRTGHAPLVGLDHIHHYMSDPAREWDGLRHGFLDLNVQLTLSGRNVSTEPLRRHRPRQRRHDQILDRSRGTQR